MGASWLRLHEVPSFGRHQNWLRLHQPCLCHVCTGAGASRGHMIGEGIEGQSLAKGRGVPPVRHSQLIAECMPVRHARYRNAFAQPPGSCAIDFRPKFPLI